MENYSAEQLAQIEEAAYRGFEIKEVAHLMGINPEIFELYFIQSNQSVTRAYLKGLYQAEYDIREAEMNSALSGSQPAQEGVKKNLKRASIKLKEIIGNG